VLRRCRQPEGPSGTGTVAFAPFALWRLHRLHCGAYYGALKCQVTEKFNGILKTKATNTKRLRQTGEKGVSRAPVPWPCAVPCAVRRAPCPVRRAPCAVCPVPCTVRRASCRACTLNNCLHSSRRPCRAEAVESLPDLTRLPTAHQVRRTRATSRNPDSSAIY
jgi:hypothetical protein